MLAPLIMKILAVLIFGFFLFTCYVVVKKAFFDEDDAAGNIEEFNYNRQRNYNYNRNYGNYNSNYNTNYGNNYSSNYNNNYNNSYNNNYNNYSTTSATSSYNY